jgi:hypothetical protein
MRGLAGRETSFLGFFANRKFLKLLQKMLQKSPNKVTEREWKLFRYGGRWESLRPGNLVLLTEKITYFFFNLGIDKSGGDKSGDST